MNKREITTEIEFLEMMIADTIAFMDANVIEQGVADEMRNNINHWRAIISILERCMATVH